MIKKMKRNLLVIGLVCFCFSAFSQFEIGPRVGLGTVFTDVESTSDDISSGDAKFGLSLGLFSQIDLGIIAIMPEVLYSSSTTSITFEDGNGDETIADSELDKIDVPVNLIISPGGLVNIQGGLVGSYIVNTDDGFIDKADEAVRNYKDFTFGYQAGLGFEFGNFLLDLRYEGNLSEVSQAQNNDLGLEFDERQSMVKALLGIKLF